MTLFASRQSQYRSIITSTKRFMNIIRKLLTRTNYRLFITSGSRKSLEPSGFSFVFYCNQGRKLLLTCKRRRFTFARVGCFIFLYDFETK